MNFKVTRKADAGEVPDVSVQIVRDGVEWERFSLGYEASRVLTDTTGEDRTGIFSAGQTEFSKGKASIAVVFDDFFKNLKGKSCKEIADEIRKRSILVQDAFSEAFPAIDEDSDEQPKPMSSKINIEIQGGKPRGIWYDTERCVYFSQLLQAHSGVYIGEVGFNQALTEFDKTLSLSVCSQELMHIFNGIGKDGLSKGQISAAITRMEDALLAATNTLSEIRGKLFPDGRYNIREELVCSPLSEDLGN